MASKPKLPDAQGKSKDYEVGYKKPPKETRFKPGQSGNPKGRTPNNHEELNALLDEIFAESISNDKGESMQKLRASLNRLLLSKNISGAMYVLDRRFGKVPTQLDVKNDGAVTLNIVYKDKPNGDGA